MPALSDSGSRLVPSGEHESIGLEEAKSFMIPLLPTQELPIVGNPMSPLPAVNTAWRSPEKVVPCRSQQIRVDALHRVTFGWQGQQLGIETASREEWLLFLVQCRVNVVGYDEGTGYQGIHRPGPYRCQYANQLLAQGKLELLRVGNEPDESAPLLLACPALAPLIGVTLPTCSDLIEEGLLPAGHCCAECHSDPHSLIEECITSDDDPFGGRKTRRRFKLCCTALQIVASRFPDKQYNSVPLHEGEDCIEKEEQDD